MMAEFEYEPDPQRLTICESVARLRQIQLGLKQAVCNLHEKLELLDSEPSLHSSLEALREDMESRATNLENEVKRLREDLKTVKGFLGVDLDKKNLSES
jgi:hypothetical protein